MNLSNLQHIVFRTSILEHSRVSIELAEKLLNNKIALYAL